MKTKQIPAIVMLTAGFAVCIITFVNDYSLSFFIRTLFGALIGFYILGYIIKIVLDISIRKQREDDITADDLGFTDGEILEDMDLGVIEEEKQE